MPRLGDFLGTLMSEIVIARVRADLETIRVAELYASDDLLRHMAIPSFRLPEVSVTVNLIVTKLEPPHDDKPPRGVPSLDEVRRTFDDTLAAQLSKAGISLEQSTRAKLKKLLDEAQAQMKVPLSIAVGLTAPVDHLAETAITYLCRAEDQAAKDNDPQEDDTQKGAKKKHKGDGLPDMPESLADDLRAAARRAVLLLAQLPERMHVEVVHQKDSDPDAARLMKLQLSILEECLEWTEIVTEGEPTKRRLIPE